MKSYLNYGRPLTTPNTIYKYLYQINNIPAITEYGISQQELPFNTPSLINHPLNDVLLKKTALLLSQLDKVVRKRFEWLEPKIQTQNKLDIEIIFNKGIRYLVLCTCIDEKEEQIVIGHSAIEMKGTDKGASYGLIEEHNPYHDFTDEQLHIMWEWILNG